MLVGAKPAKEVVTEMTERPPSQFCARCSVELHPGRGELYAISIVAVADPSPPVFTEEDFDRDVGREIDRLIKRMRGLNEQEVMEQVYHRKIIYLCVPCYHTWIEHPTRV
jgi:hypothetical protein